MAVLVVFLPLLAAAIAGFFGRVIGDRGAQIVTCGALVLSAMALGILLFRDILAQRRPQIVPIATWIAAGGVDVEWSLRLDTLSGVMILVVTIVSAMVHVYSVGYMAHDPRHPALHGLSEPVHLLHADAGDGQRLRAAVFRLGRRWPRAPIC